MNVPVVVSGRGEKMARAEAPHEIAQYILMAIVFMAVFANANI